MPLPNHPQIDSSAECTLTAEPMLSVQRNALGWGGGWKKNNRNNKNKIMKNEFAIKVLNRIQLIQHLHDNFRKWGVDISEYDDPTISLLEEAIQTMYAKTETEYEEILGWVQWWIYEDVEKIITQNGKKEDVTKVSDFVDYIEREYNKP